MSAEHALIVAALLAVVCLPIVIGLGFSSHWRRKQNFDSAIPHKGGHNDLSRWEAFGGTLKRPDAPAPMNSERERRRPF